VEKSPSWEANSYSVSQEIPRHLSNPKVPYSVHKSPPANSVLSQINPVHTVPKPIYVRSTLILFSYLHLGLPSGPFPSGFPIKILYALLISPCV
jgi:hypothetical protein